MGLEINPTIRITMSESEQQQYDLPSSCTQVVEEFRRRREMHTKDTLTVLLLQVLRNVPPNGVAEDRVSFVLRKLLSMRLQAVSASLRELVETDGARKMVIQHDVVKDLSEPQQQTVFEECLLCVLGLQEIEGFAKILTEQVDGLDLQIATDVEKQTKELLRNEVAVQVENKNRVNEPPVPTVAETATSLTPQTTPEQSPALLDIIRTARTTDKAHLTDAVDLLANNEQPANYEEVVNTALQTAWKAVPGSVRNTILDQSYKTAVRNSASHLDLSDTDLQTLEEEVLMVLLGLQSKEDFAKELGTQLPQLGTQDVTTIVTSIEERFFALLSPYLDHKQASEDAQSTVPRKLTTTSPLEQFVQNQEDVQTRFSKLPESVRTAVLSSEVAGVFAEAVRTYDLDQNRFMLFGNNAVRVMVGLATPQDFRAVVTQQTLVPAEAVEAFAGVVEQGMFRPVRDAIVQALKDRKEGKH